MPDLTPRKVIAEDLYDSWLVERDDAAESVIAALDEAGYVIVAESSGDRVETAVEAVLAKYPCGDEVTDKLVREDMQIGLAAADAGRIVIDPDDDKVAEQAAHAIQKAFDAHPLIPSEVDGGVNPYELAGIVLAALKEVR